MIPDYSKIFYVFASKISRERLLWQVKSIFLLVLPITVGPTAKSSI
jgi:hypothetical protein